LKGRHAVTALQHDSCAGHVGCEPYGRLVGEPEGELGAETMKKEVIHTDMAQSLPARTVVGVAKLRENDLLEIEATAYLP
jgi:hypothetical protein